MTTYTFNPDLNQPDVYWRDPTRWQGGVVPNGADADVVIRLIVRPSTGVPYSSNLYIVTNEGFQERSVSFNTNNLNLGGQLAVTGAFTANNSLLVMSGGALTVGSMSLTGSTLLQGHGSIVDSSAFTNNGTITGTSGLTISAQGFTNNGTLFGNLTIDVPSGAFSNLSNSTLSEGIYSVGSGERLILKAGDIIQTLNAKVSYDGSAGEQYTLYSSDAQGVLHPLQSTLRTIGAAGNLSIAGPYTTTSLYVLGNLSLNGSLSADRLDVHAGGKLSSTGLALSRIGGPIHNDGMITATAFGSGFYSGANILILNGDISGTGSLLVGPHATLTHYGSADFIGAALELAGSDLIGVRFADGSGTLVLDHPDTFYGTVTPSVDGAGSGTFNGDPLGVPTLATINVRGASVGSYHYSGDVDGGTLVLNETDGTSFSIKFAGAFDDAAFQVSAGSQDPTPSVNIRVIDIYKPADFDDNSSSDVLWWHAPSGLTGYWALSGGENTGFRALGTLTGGNLYSVAAKGYYTGSSSITDADVLFRQNESGEVGFWKIQDGQNQGFQSLGIVEKSWSIVNTQGHSDFNGDHVDDILWRDSATGTVVDWTMSRYGQTGTNVFPQVDAAWQVVGTGQFETDDLRDEILWQHGSGLVGYWHFDANGANPSFASLGNPGSDWKVIGTGDFDGNGLTDVLWRQDGSNAVGYWQMFENPNTFEHSHVWVPEGTVDQSWQVKGTGQYGGDAREDVLWRHASGDTGYWQSDDTAAHHTFHDLGAVGNDWLIL